jgi:hypothetical protein
LQKELKQLEQQLQTEENSKTDTAKIKQQKEQALQLQIESVNAAIEQATTSQLSAASGKSLDTTA